MNKVIIHENSTIEEANLLAKQLECNCVNVESSDIDNDFDFLIVLFTANKGRCSLEIENFISRAKTKYVALIAKSKTGFDINRMLISNLKKRGAIPVYSKYYTEFEKENIAEELENKYVCMDGFSSSEMIVGKLSRILLSNYKEKNL